MGLFFYPISVILLRNVVMKMIKFAICDDEPVMAQEITNQLSQYMQEKGLTSYCVNSFSNGRSLLENGCDFDVIFLDIQMEYLNGMETAKMLRQRKNHSILIFVTVLKEYVFDAFEVEAFDYLIKPLDSGHFKRTMDRVIISLQSKEAKSIVIQRGTSCEVILLEQILYCEVQGRKIYLSKFSISFFVFSINSSKFIAPISPCFLLRTPTLPLCASFSPKISIYGIF